jgi:hypothetical protein
MDETTLTLTLRELAADPVLHPSPSADARRRARRLRRHRRTGAAGAVVVLALGGFGGVRLSSGSQGQGAAGPPPAENWRVGLTQEGNPNHETTTAVLMPRTAGPEWAVYWQDAHLCWIQINVANQSSAGSECRGAVTTPPAPLQVTQDLTLPDAVLLAVSPEVATIRATRLDGSHIDVKPVTGPGFPYPAAVVDGRAVSLRALDAAGKQIGDAVPGADALQLRQVLTTFRCAAPPSGVTALSAPYVNDPTSCADLSATAMAIVPKAVEALYDSTQGYVIQLSFNAKDAVAFGQLTQRLTDEKAPKNQLAMVLDGKVLSAPTIEEAILGGTAQITAGTDTPWTQAYADQLAAQLRG